ncbi:MULTISPECIES: UvrD-helicase domain-containing protein [Actinoalloteichus]|uniref:DNA 3'-5' helicase n=1 Tax=Actinoalloteichus fjordicus TaxID=1612552 RepID=A0AAC9LFW8_9PSEU|nr:MULTISPECIES: UvrD-helicase domain-containing protein [Actinoalloteichus]APU16134.1 DNA/RNA helicase, superfamily I [Actinoalloteichus fjordicus]APU22197.1 DNA/RNA helicase, superfamily I [Actinoalloteichus sp. GBA129-24]
MARLAIHADFMQEYARLERSVQTKVIEVLDRFRQATHTGRHLERVGNARDRRMHTIRIDLFWRGVVLAPERGDLYTLLRVLPHDDAYTWAVRHRASVNSATGSIELRDVAAIDATYPELSRMAERRPERLFAQVNDADLGRLGIDDQTLAFARTLTDVLTLEASKAFLPERQWEVLYGLAAGMTVESVWTELGAVATAEPYDTDDVVAAVERGGDRLVLVNGPDELMKVFQESLAHWRIYLHPTQHRMAYGSFSGSARVTGGPGTGKTVVALHRAHHLAAGGVGRVLVTTFTSTLTDSLQEGLRQLPDLGPRESHVDVQTIDSLAHRIFAETHGRPTMIDAQEQQNLWRDVITTLSLPFSEAFLAEEWRQVVLGQQVLDAQGYLRAKRDGRGRKLGNIQKALVWQAMHEFTEELRRRRVHTYETVCAAAAAILAGRADKPYRHVIVDEAQDLNPMQWRLLRAAVPVASNDLFIAGDTHQRIYQHRVTLRELGVQITGRSTRLTVNYRTTAEILAWSLGMLRGERIDDMDDGLETIAGYRSQVHGAMPVLAGHSSRTVELAELCSVIEEWHAAGVKPEEIGIATRSKLAGEGVRDSLATAGVPVRLLDRKTPPAPDAVSVGTMHRMKGLEFRCVAVVGVRDQQMPLQPAVTPESEDEVAHRHDLQRERCLLFVACTRAREQLYVSWTGTPSRFLTAVQ